MAVLYATISSYGFSSARRPKTFPVIWSTGTFPYFDIPYGRIGVAELILRVMAHDNVQCTAFLFHILYEFYFATTHGTFRAHAIAAGYLFMLINEFMAEAERDHTLLLRCSISIFPPSGPEWR